MADKARRRKRPPEPESSPVPLGLLLGLIGGGAFLVVGLLAVGIILWLRSAEGSPDVAVAPATHPEPPPLRTAPPETRVPGPAAPSQKPVEEPAPTAAPKKEASPPAPPEPPREKKTQLLVLGLRNGDKLLLDDLEVPGPGPDGQKQLDVTDGAHQLKLTRTGHREWTWEGSVPKGEMVRITAAPEKLRGAVALDSAPLNKPAPEIEWEDIDGKAFKLSDYKGKVVLLDFWGNW